MAVRNICGAETGDFIEAVVTAGTVSVSSATKRTGGYSFRANPTTTGTGTIRIGTILTSGGNTIGSGMSDCRFRFYINIATLPTGSVTEEICRAVTLSAGALVMGVRVGTDGKLSAYNNSDVQIGSTGTTVLSTGTWYRIEVRAAVGTPAWEVRIDGTTEISGSDSLGATNAGGVDLGKPVNHNGKTVDFYYDDILIDDANWPGPGQVERMAPDGDGTYTAWTRGGADSGTDWGQVDEVVHNSATDYLLSTVTDDVSTVTLESAASAGISGTISAVKALVVVAENSSGSSSHYCRLRSASTDSDTDTNNLTTVYAARQKLATVDPATSAAWTTSGLDGAEVGSKQGATLQINLTMACAMVDFAPAAGAVDRVPDYNDFGRLNVEPPGVVAY